MVCVVVQGVGGVEGNGGDDLATWVTAWATWAI